MMAPDPYLDILNTTLRHIQRQIKLREAPLRNYDGGPRHVREATRHYGGTTLRELVILNVGLKSCGWNNCRMCGLSTRAEELEEEDLLEEIEAISRLPHWKNPEIRSVYFSPYSFFSDREMSEGSREKVYELINAHPHIDYAVFMTRPEYLNSSKAANMRRLLKNQRIIIWMGLETADPFVSRYCIDKGYTLADVEKASAMLKGYDIHTGIWVLLKPPFLSEKEAVEDALSTIRHGLDRGYEIRLMPNEVMSYTITCLLLDMGMYRAPYLWSVIDILNRFAPGERLRIDVSGPHFERAWSVVSREIHSSQILRFPSNCTLCNDQVFKALIQFNETKEIGALRGLDCHCRRAWEEEMDRELPPLAERLCQAFLGVINHAVEARAGHGCE